MSETPAGVKTAADASIAMFPCAKTELGGLKSKCVNGATRRNMGNSAFLCSIQPISLFVSLPTGNPNEITQINQVLYSIGAN